MRRRDFIALIPVTAITWSVGARAQQPMPVVGYRAIAARNNIASFRQGLSEAGYVDGQNLAIELHSVEGRMDRLPALAADLVRRKLDLIVTGNVAAALALKDATSTIPIVFVAADPVEDGWAPVSLGRAATSPASVSC